MTVNHNETKPTGYGNRFYTLPKDVTTMRYLDVSPNRRTYYYYRDGKYYIYDYNGCLHSIQWFAAGIRYTLTSTEKAVSLDPRYATEPGNAATFFTETCESLGITPEKDPLFDLGSRKYVLFLVVAMLLVCAIVFAWKRYPGYVSWLRWFVRRKPVFCSTAFLLITVCTVLCVTDRYSSYLAYTDNSPSASWFVSDPLDDTGFSSLHLINPRYANSAPQTHTVKVDGKTFDLVLVDAENWEYTDSTTQAAIHIDPATNHLYGFKNYNIDTLYADLQKPMPADPEKAARKKAK